MHIWQKILDSGQCPHAQTCQPKQSGRKALQDGDNPLKEIALEMLELLTTDRKLSDDEFEHLADLLADEFEKRLPEDAKPLSDYAFTRESIYDDHL